MALQEELEKQGNFLFKYRSFFPLIVLVVGLLIYLQSELQPENNILKGTVYELYYEMFALFIALVGLAIRVYAVGHANKNTSGRNTTAGQVADHLNTSGIYSMLRHPLYLGNFMMWLGPVLLTVHIWFIIAFCLLYWIYYERIMFAEEQFLRRKFGADYLKWSENVKPFIPNFKNFSKPIMPFSLKKVLKQEKNGLFALFLIFAIFDVAGEIIRNESNFNYFLIAMCIITGIAYLVLKFLKRKTNLLDEPDR